MIFELHESFLEFDFSKNHDVAAGVETAALAARRGDHFVFASRAIARKLSVDPNFSAATRGLFADIAAAFSFLAGYLRTFSRKCVIIPDDRPPQRGIADGTWVVAAQHLARKNLSRTVLLAEGAVDAAMYKEAAKHYGVVNKHPGTTAFLTIPRGGGGAAVSAELQGIADAQAEVCVCITDSDRFSPNCNPGTTSRTCTGIANASPWLIEHMATSVRELENAIPRTDLLDTASTTAPILFAAFQDARRYFGEEQMDHADIKHGTTLEWALRQPAGSPKRDFWLNSARTNPHIKATHCFQDLACAKPESCDCVIVPNLGEQIASRVLEKWNRQSGHETVRDNQGSSNFGEWLALGKVVFEMAAGPQPARI